MGCFPTYDTLFYRLGCRSWGGLYFSFRGFIPAFIVLSSCYGWCLQGRNEPLFFETGLASVPDGLPYFVTVAFRHGIVPTGPRVFSFVRPHAGSEASARLYVLGLES